MRALFLAVAATLLLAGPAAAAPTLVKVGDFDSPVHIASPPDDPRLFVVEQDGRVKVLSGGTTKTFLDVTAITETGGSEEGLLSIAFPPDYAASGRFYVYLVAKGGATLRILEFRRSADPDAADPGSLRPVVEIPHPDAGNHNGGQLQFGPDGRLWIGTGDGGGSNDPGHNAQDPASLLGKLLRIDPVAGGAPEIFASGLRNPWRFSFDRATGDLVIGDVGQGAREEIDFVPAPGWQPGANYGWPCFEANRVNAQATDPVCDTLAGDVKPTAELSRDAGFQSITGGYVVRDPGLPTLAGRYLYGDIGQDELRSIALATGSASGDRAETTLKVPIPTSFGQDACGRLYVSSIPGYAHAPGSVYRIEDGAATPCAPGGVPSAGGGGGTTRPGADTRKPRLTARVRGLSTLISRRRLRVAIATDERTAATVAGRLRGVARFKTARRQLTAGRRKVVVLRISRRTARKLRRTVRRHRVRIQVTVRVRDAAGNQRVATRRLTLRRR
jgi:hypothetical protein